MTERQTLAQPGKLTGPVAVGCSEWLGVECNTQRQGLLLVSMDVVRLMASGMCIFKSRLEISEPSDDRVKRRVEVQVGKMYLVRPKKISRTIPTP